MRLGDFDYYLPTELLAQQPMKPRDTCRFLVLNRRNGEILHRRFFEIGDFLRSGDLVVINNTKVFKARLFGQLGGKKVEIFLIRPVDVIPVSSTDQDLNEAKDLSETTEGIFRDARNDDRSYWLAIGKPGRRLQIGTCVKFADDFACKIISKNNAGELVVNFNLTPDNVIALANKYGHIPIPPYIKEEVGSVDDYQTIYAQKVGSVAAPTAGFHFTEELIKKLKKQGIEFAEITLHVGLGTFLPIREEDILAHKMHAEWVEIDAATAEKINAAKSAGRRVIAVGTTTTRALEGIARLTTDYRLRATDHRLVSMKKNKAVVGSLSSVVREFSGFVDLFIRPGFEFKIIDGLITNFHLPKSTLLVLVSAFAGRENIFKAYKEAIKQKYKFYSFGDAMLII
jgi:S-adenosylmethionine:tRNA ribosyltransferase-isomerase